MTDVVGPALNLLLDTAEARLVECSRPVGTVTLMPGNTVVWDDCCAGGGQLWVRLISLVPFPNGSQPCDVSSLQVRAGIGVVRCMHGLDDDGNPPTPAAMTGDTLGTTADADLLLQAVQEWSPPPSVARKTLVLETGVPLGPEGLCGGFEWTFSFKTLLCKGC